jgi:chromosome partitioning protein
MQESLEILPEFGILLARTQIQHRQIYRQSAVFGQSVHNFGNKAQAAIAEIESLTDEALEILTIKQGNH